MGYKIELLGLCGAGKTTFLTALTSKPVSEINFGLAYPVTPSLWQTAINLLRILAVGFLVKPISFPYFLIKKNNWWLIKKIAFRSAGIRLRGNNNCILVDSGIMQPFLSFEIEENLFNSSVPIRAILASSVLPDLLLVFSVPPKIAMERYEQRGLRGEGKLIRINSKNYFDRAENLRKDLISYCKEKNVRIIEVNSSHNFTQEYLNNKLIEIEKFINQGESKK